MGISPVLVIRDWCDRAWPGITLPHAEVCLDYCQLPGNIHWPTIPEPSNGRPADWTVDIIDFILALIENSLAQRSCKFKGCEWLAVCGSGGRSDLLLLLLESAD